MIRIVLGLAVLLAAFSIAASDEERAPWPHVTSSDSGRYYFRMTPPKGSEPAHGTMYRTVGAGKDEALWSVKGWYAQQVLVPDNGEHVVVMGDWPRGLGPSEEHLAVAFYTRGELVRRYSTKELIKDPSKVRPSVSHYQYRDWDTPPAILGLHVGGSYRIVFRLRTVDGVTYLFDFVSGKIISASPSEQDVVANEQTARAIGRAVIRARFDMRFKAGTETRASRLRDEWFVSAAQDGRTYEVRLKARDGRVVRLEKRP